MLLHSILHERRTGNKLPQQYKFRSMHLAHPVTEIVTNVGVRYPGVCHHWAQYINEWDKVIGHSLGIIIRRVCTAVTCIIVSLMDSDNEYLLMDQWHAPSEFQWVKTFRVHTFRCRQTVAEVSGCNQWHHDVTLVPYAFSAEQRKGQTAEVTWSKDCNPNVFTIFFYYNTFAINESDVFSLFVHVTKETRRVSKELKNKALTSDDETVQYHLVVLHRVC